jgi:hypothetical protein
LLERLRRFLILVGGDGFSFSVVSFQCDGAGDGVASSAVLVPVQAFGELAELVRGLRHSGKLVSVTGRLWEWGRALAVLAGSVRFFGGG